MRERGRSVGENTGQKEGWEHRAQAQADATKLYTSFLLELIIDGDIIIDGDKA